MIGWIDRRLVACAIASIVGHVALARALDELPERETVAPPRATIEIRVVTPPPPPIVAPEPPPPVPVAKPAPIEPAHRPLRAATRATPEAHHDAPVVAPSPAADPSAKPVFGVTMESTSQAGHTAVPVGNTLQPQHGTPAPGAVKPLAVAAADEVTKMPLPQGRCAGTYTDAARAAGIEGVVVLDLVVDEAGRARDIHVVEGLGHGLTEAAVTALRDCQFTPGEKAGVRVAVRIRGFKIRFVLQDG